MEYVTLKVKVDSADARLNIQSVRKAVTDLQTVSSKPITISVKTSGANASIFRDVDASMGQLDATAVKTGDTFTSLYAKIAKWGIMTSVVYGPIKAFREALTTLKAVDTEMVNVQKVTDYSNTQMKALEENAYSLASAYGRTADEIASMYTTFARAGYLGNELDSMTELGTLLANIGDISQDTASKFLLAVDAAWKLNGSESELMAVMDGLNEITNKNAVDMEGLTSGITVAGSVFAEAGESVQTFSALVGAGIAATQRSGSEISRGLRTIIMNIRQIKGETEDGELIDGESIAKASNALREYAGISTMANGQLRESSAVLSDLAGKWDALDTVAQSAIAEALAGKRQANILTALMGNWDVVEKMMQDYADGAGSALRENEIYLDSWEAKSKQLTASWTEFVSHLVETDTIKGALDGVIGLVEFLDSDVGHAVLTVAALTAAMIALGQSVNWLKGTEFFQAAIWKNLSQWMSWVSSGALGVGQSFRLLGQTIIQSINPAVLAIAGAAAALAIIIKISESASKTYSDWSQEVENTNKQLKTNKGRISEINSLPWNERTQEILDEKKALEEENAELEKNLELQQKKQLKAAIKELSEDTDSSAYVEGGTFLGGYTPTSGLNGRAGLIDEANKYIEALDREGELTGKQNAEAEKLMAKMAERASLYGFLKTHSDELNASERQQLNSLAEEVSAYEALVSAYDRAVYGQEMLISSTAELNTQGYVAEETYNRLIGIYPELAKNAEKTADGYVIQKDALEELMTAESQQRAKMRTIVSGLAEEAAQSGKTQKELYDLVAAQITASNTKLNFSQQIMALKELGYQAGLTASQVIAATGMLGNYQDQRNIEQTVKGLMQLKGMTRAEAEAKVYGDLQKNLWKEIMQNGGWSGSASGTYKSDYTDDSVSKKKEQEAEKLANAKKKAAQATIDAIKRQRDAETDAIDEQIDALKKQNEETERGEKLEELKLNILKKQDALLNARNERTVRQYNAATGQWEWVADAQKVKDAEEALEDAKKDLRDYERDTERELAIEELEARKKAIEAAYQLKIDTWQKLIDELNGDVETEAALLAASRGDWETYYQEMLKVYQKLLDAAQDYEDKKQEIQNSGNTGGDTTGGNEDSGSGDGDDSSKGNDTGDDNKSSPTSEVDRLTPAQRIIYDMWMRRGVGTYEALRQAKQNASDKVKDNFDKTSESSKDYEKTTVGKLDGLTKKDTGSSGSTSGSGKKKPSGGGNTLGGGKNINKVSRYDSGGVLHGLGGIKATVDDEMVLPPDVTRKLLTPSAENRAMEVISGMRLALNDRTPYGQSLAGVTNNSTDSHDVSYCVNGVPISADMAKLPMEQIVRQLNMAAFQGQVFNGW